MSNPDPGVDAWEALLRVHASVLPLLEREVLEATGLSLSRYDVLLELNRVPERRLRLSELSERVVLSRTRISRLLEDMAAEGLIAKSPDPADGRATFALLTPQGRMMLRRAAPIYLDAIRRHFSERLTRHEQRLIAGALRRVVESIDEEPAN